MTITQNKSLESLMDFKFNITEVMESLDTLEFDIFDFKVKTDNRELTSLTSLLFHKHSLYSGLNIQVNQFLVYMDKVASGYKSQVEYHNSTHAADVCQTLYSFAMNGNWIESSKLDNIDICSMIIAAAVHDYEHPGTNNVFLINVQDKLAIRYNDVSVLENHHVASSYALLKMQQYNFLNKLGPDENEGIRKRMIHMVLSTDMSKHFSEIGTFKAKINSESFDPKEKDKLLCMGVGMHLADISNPTKPWNLTLKWTELLFEEFFKQGDKERKMEMVISDLMDRTTVNIAKAQLGFIDVIVNPAFETVSKFLKCLSKNIKNMKKNRANWESRIGEYQDRMMGDIKIMGSMNEVIEEVKELSEEDSDSNKMSSFVDSSESEEGGDEIKEEEKNLKNKSKDTSFDSIL